ncbi:MAG: PIN domain-containing protein [Bacteroidales bacterium]|nr:PIN domain-containing protein [Bacteroidales bacterium]
MRKIFFDTNFLLDVLIKDRVGHEEAVLVLSLLKKFHTEIVCSTQSLLDTYYIAGRKKIIKQEIDVLTSWLVHYANVRSIGWFELRDALMSAEKDIEDAAQIALAKTEHCEVFLTTDQRILNKEQEESLLFMSPAGFIEKISNVQSTHS